jgi:exodeoxyribonuclease VII small subunit
MKNSNSNTSYRTAKAELEKIVNELKRGTADIDSMAENVRRGTELLNVCRERLRQVEANILPDAEEESGENYNTF